MRHNDQSNRLIKWIVTVGDFVLLNAILLGFAHWHWRMGTWQTGRVEIFILVNNIALMLSMLKFSTFILGITALLFPIIYLIIKIQSPGPIFFKQLRTGVDGEDFLCYKFRSMHVNKDADRLQN